MAAAVGRCQPEGGGQSVSRHRVRALTLPDRPRDEGDAGTYGQRSWPDQSRPDAEQDPQKHGATTRSAGIDGSVGLERLRACATPRISQILLAEQDVNTYTELEVAGRGSGNVACTCPGTDTASPPPENVGRTESMHVGGV